MGIITERLPENVSLIITNELPDSVHGCIAEIGTGKFLILINGNDAEEKQRKALAHELHHYYNGDFSSGRTVTDIEIEAHGKRV